MPIQVCFKGGQHPQINANAPKGQDLQQPKERSSLPLGMQGRWVQTPPTLEKPLEPSVRGSKNTPKSTNLSHT